MNPINLMNKLVKYCENGDAYKMQEILNSFNDQTFLQVFLNKNGKLFRDACYYRYLNIVKLMLEKCEKLELENFKIHDILKYKNYSCLSSTTTFSSSGVSPLDVAKYLVEKIKATSGNPQKINAIFSDIKYEPIMNACRNGDLELTKYFASEYDLEADVMWALTTDDENDPNRDSCVYFAICSLNIDLIKYVVKNAKNRMSYIDRLINEMLYGLHQILFGNEKATKYFNDENNEQNSLEKMLADLRPMLNDKMYEIVSYLIGQCKIINEEQENRCRQEKLDKIMRKNGWRM